MAPAYSLTTQTYHGTVYGPGDELTGMPEPLVEQLVERGTATLTPPTVEGEVVENGETPAPEDDAAGHEPPAATPDAAPAVPETAASTGEDASAPVPPAG